MILRLPGGTCANVGHTKVCAIKQTPKTVTRTLRLVPPVVGDHGSPFEASIEDLGGNGNLCPINSGTEQLNPGAVCTVPVDFPRPAPAGTTWAHGTYQDIWYWRGWTLPGVSCITPYVHLTGLL